MLHVSVVSPAGLTDRLIESLAADQGVQNLVVLRGAVTHPNGDAVQFDVGTGSANSVLSRLRALGLDRDGSVVLGTIEASIAQGPRSAEWRRPRLGEQAPVWDLVESRIRQDADYAPSFFVLLVFAGLIGACGILTNSQILIVGAMVVGPEYSAIISVALGIERHDARAVWRGLLALLVGFLLAIAVTLVFAVCIRAVGRAPKLYLEGIRPVSDLINSPNLFSVVVAVVAGLVGVVSLTLSRAGAMIGVFISITTIPAAADIAVSLAFGSWREARGSGLQLLLNVGLLIVVGALALRLQRVIWRDRPLRPPAAGKVRQT
jgi:uncharacterized hydrophobic protein (TIGR00271 family)